MLLGAIALIARLLPWARTVDDAFITFRYSRNLVEGHGFVYNLGERILGTTTPLYTLWMACCGLLFGDHYPTFALFTNALADMVGVLLLYWIVYSLTQQRWLAFWMGLLWAIAPFSVTFAIGGMETSVHNLWMLGAFAAYLQDRPRWLGAMCALGVLTRPDALLWAVPLLVHQVWWTFWNRRGDLKVTPTPQYPFLQTWAVGLILFLPWMLFAWAYFGSPIPHTVSTKAVVYDVKSTQALETFLPHYATPFQGQFTLDRYAVMLGIFLFPVLAVIGLRWASAKTSRALPILLYPWIYLAVFIYLNPLIFRWYLTPPLPAYFIAIACGAYALWGLIPSLPLRRGLAIAAAAITLLFGLQAWTLHPDHGKARPTPQMAFNDIELNYERMAQTLRRDYGLTEEDTLAAGDIGSLGYYSRARIFDTIGLVTEGTTDYYSDPEALRALRAEDQNYVIPPDLILDRQPDFIVVMEGFIRNGLALDPRFIEQYELIEEIPTDYYGTGMLAFRRRTPE